MVHVLRHGRSGIHSEMIGGTQKLIGGSPPIMTAGRVCKASH
jgi:hypothetical protein